MPEWSGALQSPSLYRGVDGSMATKTDMPHSRARTHEGGSAAEDDTSIPRMMISVLNMLRINQSI